MKRKILILIITIVAMAATQNAYCQTALYNQYKHLTDVRVVCIMDFPVDENVKVDITMLEPKTKEAVKALEALKLNRRVTVVTNEVNENALRAFANLGDVNVTTANLLNTYELVSSDYVVITKDAIKTIEEGNK